jgi:hypothetical protein
VVWYLKSISSLQSFSPPSWYLLTKEANRQIFRSLRFGTPAPPPPQSLWPY